MRLFLVHYSKCLSVAIAAERTDISERLPYMWKRRTDRIGRWFVERLKRAETTAVERIRAQAFDAALVKKSESMMLAILRARDPWFQPPPKQMEHKHKQTGPPASVSISTTSIAFGHFTDEEMETLDRLLKKAGVPSTRRPSTWTRKR
jgi:hypothetical protein